MEYRNARRVVKKAKESHKKMGKRKKGKRKEFDGERKIDINAEVVTFEAV